MEPPLPLPDIEICLLRLGDARDLAPLISLYNQAVFRGAPDAPDRFYAEQLLQDRAAELLGARLDGALVGFLLFHDLPDLWTGMRAGLVDHLFVHHAHRRKGIARAMLDLLAEEADTRGWSKLVLNAPRGAGAVRPFFDRVAVPADWGSYVIRFAGRTAS